jgi:hypothetical protein
MAKALWVTRFADEEEVVGYCKALRGEQPTDFFGNIKRPALSACVVAKTS